MAAATSWLARVDHEPGEFSGSGTAVFCRWGRVEPHDSIDALSVQVEVTSGRVLGMWPTSE